MMPGIARSSADDKDIYPVVHLSAKVKKTRIDSLLTARGLVESRARAQALIMAGRVLVEGAVVDKAGRLVNSESLITLKEGPKYVSRGGIKLASFLDELEFDVEGRVALDVGASTGGFTDCLLQRGAARVIAVDVGKGILDYRLRNDPRVMLLEGRNIRYMEPSDLGGAVVDLAVIDVAFISLELVLPKVKELARADGRILALVKPQFEVGKGEVGKGGIVRDPAKHRAVVERIKGFAEELGLSAIAESESPITGAKGNKEFWLCLAC
jgi:23S rRNA (cytidine1920-2'-O)/16S rRNA (cytidine1409-2'-O)-methyltransferase